MQKLDFFDSLVSIRNFASGSLMGYDLTAHMVMMTCRFPFIPTDLKSPVGLFVGV